MPRAVDAVRRRKLTKIFSWEEIFKHLRLQLSLLIYCRVLFASLSFAVALFRAPPFLTPALCATIINDVTCSVTDIDHGEFLEPCLHKSDANVNINNLECSNPIFL